MTQNPNNEDFLLIGEIVAAFGIKGQVKMRSLTDNIEHLQRNVTSVYIGAKHKQHRKRRYLSPSCSNRNRCIDTCNNT